MKQKILDFLKYVGTFCLLLIIASPFVLMICWGAYNIEQDKQSNSVSEVKPLDVVDTVTSFTGSRIWVGGSGLNAVQNLYYRDYLVDVTFRFADDGYGVTPSVVLSSYTGNADGTVSISTVGTFRNFTYTSNDPMTESFFSYLIVGGSVVGVRYLLTSHNIGGIIGVDYGVVQEPFDYLNPITGAVSKTTPCSFVLRYFTADDGFFTVYFGTFCTVEQFPLRTYYFNDGVENLDGYQQGFTSGYDSGLSAGYSNGYDNGFSGGRVIGYNSGYSAGLVAGQNNDYTFIGLLGAVVDAPVTAFMSLLNFEVFGFNMLKLVTGLFTLAIIVVVVRVVVGKG